MRRTCLAALLALFHTAAGSFGGSPAFAGNSAFTGNAAGGFPEARETLPHESAAAETLRFTPATAPEIRFVGRAARSDDGALSFDWSGAYFSFRFEGTRCAMRAADSKRNYYNVFVDGKPHGKVTAEGPAKTIVLAEGLPHGVHTVLVQKRTEGEQGRTTLFAVGSDGPLLDAPQAPGRHIEFIGDSHTCGYGTEGKSPKEPFTPETENCDLAWGCIIARYFDADYTLIAHSGQGIVRNWGDEKEVSDCTMRERMMRTFDMEETPLWDFAQYRPDIVVIKLGSNDFSEGVAPSEEAFNASYAQALRQIRAAYGDVPVLCVAPAENTTVYGYLQTFLREQQDPALHCTVMTPGITDWGNDMGANFHPNHRGHRKLASAIIPYIATITGWEMPEKVVY